MHTSRHQRSVCTALVAVGLMSPAAAVSPYRFQEIYRQNAVAVVRVEATAEKRSWVNSAFLIREDGVLLTVAAPVQRAHQIAVLDAQGGRLEAILLGVDPRTGVAVLRAPSAGRLPTLAISQGRRPRDGDWLVGIGHDGGGGSDARAGCVSALTPGSAKRPTLITVDASTSPGGPLLDLGGQVVAMALRPEGSRRVVAVVTEEFMPFVRDLLQRHDAAGMQPSRLSTEAAQ